MAVDINPIPPIEPGSSTVTDAVSSANEAFLRINAISQLVNKNEAGIGRLSDLRTRDKENLVEAVNEIYTAFLDGFLLEKVTGSLLDLTTTNKTNLVAAINEHDKEIGALTSLNTPVKTSLVEAINAIAQSSTDIGDLSLLLTQDRFTLVAAINEVFTTIGYINNLATGDDDIVSAVNGNFTRIGNLQTLQTRRKSTLVEAINELKGRADGFLKLDGTNKATGNLDIGGKRITNLGLATADTDAVPRVQVQEIAQTGNLTNLGTTAKSTLVGAINELVNYQGVLRSLKTNDKASLVAAINEVYDASGAANMQTKLELVQSVDFGRGISSDHNQAFKFFASQAVGDYDFQILRSGGTNGNAVIDNKGSGYIYIAHNGVNIARFQNVTTGDNTPLQIRKGNDWVNVATGAESLPLIGGTVTGAIKVKASATGGSIQLIPGDATHTGYMDFVAPNGDRKGYIGYADATGSTWINLGHENGAVGLQVLGRLKVVGAIETPADITGLSDARYKQNIRPIDKPLESLSKLMGRSYTMHEEEAFGVVAQEVEEHFPHLVTTNEEGEKRVKYLQIIGLLIESVKELKVKVEALENK